MNILSRSIAAAAALTLSTLAALGADGFTFQDTAGDHLDVLTGGKVVARYMYAHDESTPARKAETYKPFLHVFDPEGTAPITKGAGGAFTHHRGMFIGWMKIGVGGGSFDRWHMKGGDQVHQEFLAQKPGATASFTSKAVWQGKSASEVILEEERTLTFSAPPAPAYAKIEMTSKLKAVAGETKLDGDPEHSGLQFRPADEVDRKKTTYLYPVESAAPHKDLGYPWIGETFFLQGKPYSVVYLSHPSNPADPRISAYRDYGRFGEFWQTSIPAGETKAFRVQVLVVAGEMPKADWIQKAWNEYAGENRPVPATTAKNAEYGNSPDTKKAAAKPGAMPAAKPADEAK